MILPDLYWDNYDLVLSHNYGAKFALHNTFVDGRYDIAALSENLNSDGEKKILLLNFPNNPTGYTLTEKEADRLRDELLAAAKKGKKIAVLLDDAYFGLVSERAVTKIALWRLVDLHENIWRSNRRCNKEDYVWGFRVAFITFGGKESTHKLLQHLRPRRAVSFRASVSIAPIQRKSNLLKAFHHQLRAQKRENMS